MITKTVIFVCFELYERPAKIAQKLKSQGIKVIMVYTNCYDHYYLSFFSETHRISSIFELVKIVAKNAAKFVHIFSKSKEPFGDNLSKMKVLPFIFDYKDLFENLMGSDNQELYDQQRNSVTGAVAVTYRDNQFREYLYRNNLRIYSPTISLPDPVIFQYKIEERTSKNQICLGGNFVIEKMQPQFSGLGQHAIAHFFAANNFEFHLYAYRHDHAEKSPEAMEQYLDLAANNKNFFLHQRLPTQEYIRAISKHSFGSALLPMFHFKELINLHYIKLPLIGFGARNIEYVSAGLPIICNYEHVDVRDFVLDHGIGIALRGNELKDIRSIIERSNYDRLLSNVLSLRNKMATESESWDRLIELYDTLNQRIPNLDYSSWPISE